MLFAQDASLKMEFKEDSGGRSPISQRRLDEQERLHDCNAMIDFIAKHGRNS